jgi:hypothetical protein
MQIATHWQSAYTPPGYAHAPERIKKTAKARVFEYLEKHGARAKDDILKDTGLTEAQLRHSIAALRGQVEFEQSGNGKTRTCLYWLTSNPPPTENRCASHRVYEWYKSNPWRPAADIPSDIYSVGGHKHGCVCMLEKLGRLISRVKNGRKQYKAVV